MEKSYSQSCENNRAAILEVLKEIINNDNQHLLEIGSGTGQHSVYFAPSFPYMKWLTSDRSINHPSIKAWKNESQISNILDPIEFEIGTHQFPKTKIDIVFTANTFHIMSWKKVKTLIKYFGNNLEDGAQVVIYGPFNYKGEYTSTSNAKFDEFLKAQDPKSGIRSFEDIDKQMSNSGLVLTKDYPMPANNRILLYFKAPTAQ